MTTYTNEADKMNIKVHMAHKWSGPSFHLVGEDGKGYGYICSNVDWDEPTIACARRHMKEFYGVDDVTFELMKD